MVQMTAWPVWRSCLPTRGVPVAEVARVNRCRAAIAQVRAPSDTAAAVARVGEFARDGAAGRGGAARGPRGTPWRVPEGGRGRARVGPRSGSGRGEVLTDSPGTVQ